MLDKARKMLYYIDVYKWLKLKNMCLYIIYVESKGGYFAVNDGES